eukprot:Sspe_Gene.118107::Locus_110820_Transcript_1_1_Confidence_1.000_Length_3224::g.118107::m.118107
MHTYPTAPPLDLVAPLPGDDGRDVKDEALPPPDTMPDCFEKRIEQMYHDEVTRGILDLGQAVDALLELAHDDLAEGPAVLCHLRDLRRRVKEKTIDRDGRRAVLREVRRKVVGGFDARRALHLVAMSENRCKLAGCKDAVVFLGYTGVGKSTLLHMICGSELRYDEELNTITVRKVRAEYEEFLRHVKIGENSARSQTRFVSAVRRSWGEGGRTHSVVLLDPAGFEDTEGNEVNVANVFSLTNTLQQCGTVRPVVLISPDTFEKKLKDLRKLANTLATMVPSFREHLSSFTFLFTKFGEGYSCRKLERRLGQLIDEIKHDPSDVVTTAVLSELRSRVALPKLVVLMEEPDEGEWEERIKALESVLVVRTKRGWEVRFARERNLGVGTEVLSEGKRVGVIEQEVKRAPEGGEEGVVVVEGEETIRDLDAWLQGLERKARSLLEKCPRFVGPPGSGTPGAEELLGEVTRREGISEPGRVFERVLAEDDRLAVEGRASRCELLLRKALARGDFGMVAWWLRELRWIMELTRELGKGQLGRRQHDACVQCVREVACDVRSSGGQVLEAARDLRYPLQDESVEELGRHLETLRLMGIELGEELGGDEGVDPSLLAEQVGSVRRDLYKGLEESGWRVDREQANALGKLRQLQTLASSDTARGWYRRALEQIRAAFEARVEAVQRMCPREVLEDIAHELGVLRETRDRMVEGGFVDDATVLDKPLEAAKERIAGGIAVDWDAGGDVRVLEEAVRRLDRAQVLAPFLGHERVTGPRETLLEVGVAECRRLCLELRESLEGSSEAGRNANERKTLGRIRELRAISELREPTEEDFWQVRIELDRIFFAAGSKALEFGVKEYLGHGRSECLRRAKEQLEAVQRVKYLDTDSYEQVLGRVGKELHRIVDGHTQHLERAELSDLAFVEGPEWLRRELCGMVRLSEVGRVLGGLFDSVREEMDDAFPSVGDKVRGADEGFRARGRLLLEAARQVMCPGEGRASRELEDLKEVLREFESQDPRQGVLREFGVRSSRDLEAQIDELEQETAALQRGEEVKVKEAEARVR